MPPKDVSAKGDLVLLKIKAVFVVFCFCFLMSLCVWKLNEDIAEIVAALNLK